MKYLFIAALLFSAQLGAVEANDLKEICHQGVVYLIYDGWKESGMTVKYNKDGTIATCES